MEGLQEGKRQGGGNLCTQASGSQGWACPSCVPSLSTPLKPLLSNMQTQLSWAGGFQRVCTPQPIASLSSWSEPSSQEQGVSLGETFM